LVKTVTVSVSVDGRGKGESPLCDRCCIGGDCAAEWNEEWVDVDSMDGDFKLETRGGTRCESSSSSSAIEANCLDDCGTVSPLVVCSLTGAVGLGEHVEEYWEEGDKVLELVLAVMVCVVSLGESARVMKDDTSGGNCIRLSCLNLLGIAEGSSV
jgi:hypothetical protein